MLQVTDNFSKMKVHWWTYNHCLFVECLANVAIRYGWISDTKFQKFSDRDWILICKNFLGMDQELKSQYPLTSVVKGSFFYFLQMFCSDLQFWFRFRG